MSVLYQVRNAIYQPQTAYRRWRHRHYDPADLTMMDHFRYRSSFLDYLRAVAAQPDLIHAFDLDRGSIVLDIGGHVGRWCRPVAERYGATIHVFEPSSSPMAQLERATNDLDSVTIHRYGLGASTFTAELSEKGPGSSTIDSAGADDHQEVVIRDIVDVIDELGLEDIALAKINIEGGEYDLLDHLLDTGRIEQVDTLLIQFHEWIPRAYWRRWRIRRRLRHTHREIWNHDWIWERWERRDGIRGQG